MNLEINREENLVRVHINPTIYSLDVIYSASYVFLDRAYVMIDGNPAKEVIIELKPKNNENLEKLGGEFNNELLNYSFYKTQVEKNAKIREAIIQRALATSESSEPPLFKDGKGIFNSDSAKEAFVDDPKGIAIPWEEKYGRKNKK